MSDTQGPAPQPIDQTALRRLLGCFPTGVAVITTRDFNGQPVGLTCNSFSSVSLEPPLVLFSLRKASRSLNTFLGASTFAINVLSERQDAVSNRFASAELKDKFAEVAWTPGRLGLPLIDDCMASFECATHARHEAGDHYLLIGEIKHMAAGAADQALVFYKGAYMMLAESLRSLVIKGRLTPPALDEAYGALFASLLKLACERATEAEIDAIDQAVDVLESHTTPEQLAARVEAAVRFFASIAAAAHNEALELMAQTVTTILRERMRLSAPVRARPDLIPLRREVVQCLRRRDAEAATTAMERLIRGLRAHAALPAAAA